LFVDHNADRLPQRAELLDRREEGMLVLSRKVSQQVMIGTDIRITIVRIDRNQVRLGIQAPAGVPILRNELADVPPAPSADENRAGPIPVRSRRIGRSED
jgi:carbon storage regulator